jgi:starch phosphorylase
MARLLRSACCRLRHPLRIWHLCNPGEIVRPQIHYEVKFGGHAEVSKDKRERYQVRWLPDTEVKGDAYDAPILGYRPG